MENIPWWKTVRRSKKPRNRRGFLMQVFDAMACQVGCP
jgi:hypothetical protein